MKKNSRARVSGWLAVPTPLAQTLMLMLSLASAAACADGWTLVFEDEFNGSTLDRERWATRYIYNNEKLDHLNDELQTYTDNDTHIVKDGALSLVARPVGGGKYESGLIRSRQTFYYGYVEARVFLPRGRGIWPAFWLNPDYDTEGQLRWPPEIDIFEYAVNGKDDTDAMFHSVGAQSKTTPITYLYRDPRYSERFRSFVADRPLNRDWHIFGLAWAPDRITVFLDGTRIFTSLYAWKRKDGALGGPAHVLLNFAVGGKWAGRYGIDTDLFPQAMRVDYVRICQFTTGDAGTKVCGKSTVSPDPATYSYRTAFNDLPKPVMAGARVTRFQDDALISAIAVNDALRIAVPVALPDDLPGNRTLRVSLKAKGAYRPSGSALTALPIATATTQTKAKERTLRAVPDVVIPITKQMKAGDYDILAEVLSANSTGGSPNRTPVSCDAAEDRLVKALSCRVGKITVTR